MATFIPNEHQVKIRAQAREFAQQVLGKANSTYSKYDDQSSRFRSTRSYYEQAVTAGYIQAQIPAGLGGSNSSLVDSAIVLEEQYAVDPSVSLTIAGTGLGLTPLILGGTPQLYEEFLQPFLSRSGAPLASLVHSEPGGTANWLEKGAPGLQTTAYEQDGKWFINGEKLWTTNSAGWDGKGADLQCVVCRAVSPSGETGNELHEAVVILLVTRDTIRENNPSAYSLIEEPELVGHKAVSGPHTRFCEFVVPSKNLLAAPAEGAGLVEKAFGMSAGFVGAMSVGIMRAAFENALQFSKQDSRGGISPIIERQSVADQLIAIKIQLDAARLLTWNAMDALQNGRENALEACLQAKIFGSDNAVESVVSAMKVIGITSYSEKWPLARILNEALCLSLFDGGNVGVRRRQYQSILQGSDISAFQTGRESQ
ncbi:acyl-CoA dehydrogenase [Penicillium angulare]|uniref:Acyl-CoA dehydrogenase n=1 Tax=Penicillium angulare TaxID=116970 RepID=A0A9W9GDS3_9EURO|nr:acyl-CoA dehydrogenase [Penicillium angulare]